MEHAMRYRTDRLLIRPWDPVSDIEFVRSLSKEVFAPYARDPERLTISMTEEAGSDTYIAEWDGIPVGFSILSYTPLRRAFGPWKNPVIARLNAIAVLPDLHGGGIGRNLLTWAQNTARFRGSTTMTLTTAENNVRARRLFEYAGFHPVTRLFDVYAGGRPGIIMFKNI